MAQVEQDDQHGAVRPDGTSAGGVQAALGVDVENEPVDLIAAQARHVRYPFSTRDGLSAKIVCVVTSQVIYPRTAVASIPDTSRGVQDRFVCIHRQ